MDLYHGWFDLKPGVRDLDFAEKLETYLAHLKEEGLIEGWRLSRRKLGLGIAELGEFHVVMEVKNLAQLETAFERVAARREPTEGFHFGMNSLVQNAKFALYRDFPDAFRHKGEERF